MAIELSVAAWIVTVAEPDVELIVAVTLVVPAAVEVRNPLLPLVLLTLAYEGFETLQCAELVTVCCEPSLKVAVAANCCVCPAASVTEAGLTAIAVTTALVPVTVSFALTVPLVAVIVALPVAPMTTFPVELTDATLGAELLHVAVLVRSCVLPSE